MHTFDTTKQKYSNIKGSFGVRNLGQLVQANVRIPRITITTEYPGGVYRLTKQNGRIHIAAKNADSSKIPWNDQRLFLARLLRSAQSTIREREIRRSMTISCKQSFVCLENFRDIHQGVIQRLLLDTTCDFQYAKIGSFGYLAKNTKPLRTSFMQKAVEFPDQLMYIPTKKYNPRDPSMLSWTDVKHMFKYLIDVPGHTYSTKLYPMLFCQRLIFLVEDRQHMFAWERHVLPYVHYVPVKNDFSDIVEKYQWAESNPDKVTDIVQNAYLLATTTLHPSRLAEQFKQCILRHFV